MTNKDIILRHTFPSEEGDHTLKLSSRVRVLKVGQKPLENQFSVWTIGNKAPPRGLFLLTFKCVFTNAYFDSKYLKYMDTYFLSGNKYALHVFLDLESSALQPPSYPPNLLV